MSNTSMKQVRVDNWGTYFLQRIKHFFNRTDYCDLTLQFQDNAQLKVHRLVLNACTEYFELLERTCEMYEDCLIMPDDLQADVVLPIINFMYTGLLNYEPILYHRLYSTAQIMNMHVLTKLLESQRPPTSSTLPQQSRVSTPAHISHTAHISSSAHTSMHSQKKVYTKRTMPTMHPQHTYTQYRDLSKEVYRPKHSPNPPRPTRYELPDDVDPDDFESSFADLSYETKPLKHPQFYKPKLEKESYTTPVLFDDVSDQAGSSSEKFEELQRIMKRPSTSINSSLQAKRLKQQRQSIYQEQPQEDLLDGVVDNRQRPSERTTEIKVGLGNSGESNVDHAKIISEVLKQYPHLVKNSKNIKLKILNPSIKNEPRAAMLKKSPVPTQSLIKKPSNLWHERTIKQEVDENPEMSYNMSKVMDTREVSRLVALGAENVKGPWLCLSCGTPGQALNFPSYRKYRGHLVDVHKMRLSHNQCEFCGLKSGKRNHLLHHLYTKHGVPPPRNYSFPKCNQCDYIALTQAFLVKHKNSHVRQTRMYPQQNNKINKCAYCFRVFQRESNLYSHMKIAHCAAATRDGLLENSDDDEMDLERNYSMKYEELEAAKATLPEHVQIHTNSDGNIQIVRKIERATPKPALPVQKILNAGLCGNSSPAKHYTTPKRVAREIEDADSQSTTIEHGKIQDRIVFLNDNEYLLTAEEVQENESIEDNVEVQNGNQFILSEVEEYSQERHTLNFAMPQQSEEQVQPIVTSQAQHVALPPKIIKRQVKPLVQEPSEQVQAMNQEQYKGLVSSSSLIFGDDVQKPAVNTMASSNSGVCASSTHSSDIVILQDVTVSRPMPGDNSNIVVVYSHAVDPNDKDYIPIDAAFLESHEAAQRACNAVVPVSQPQVTRILTEQGVVHETVQVWHNPVQQDQQQESIVKETHSQIMEDPIVNSNNQIVVSQEGSLYQNEPEIEEIQMQQNHATQITQNDQMEISFESSIQEQPTIEGEIDAQISKDDGDSAELSEDPSLESATVEINYEDDPVQNSILEDGATDMVANEEEQIVHTEEIVTECTNSVEVEESIENIEQEVQKHLKQRQERESDQSQDESEICSEMEVSNTTPETRESTSHENTPKVNEAVKMSLLTDWDENDLQSEVELVEIKDSEGTIDQETEVIEEIAISEDTEQVLEIEQIPDKNKIEINTLVQDWDEEQDEN